MADWYLDFVGGNDANDGTSFANRKKTLNSLTSVAAGDTIRTMMSAPASATGWDTLFTRQGITVTLPASGVTTQALYLDGAWTASTNVTCTTSTTRQEGSNSSSIAIAAAFTTGKAAYYATGTLNLSSYQTISFWIRPNATVAANSLRLDLCSDAAGATPVNSFTIASALTANTWQCITIDSGGALGSSIASIALNVLIDVGTTTVLIDDVLACKALTDPQCLTLDHLISSNGTEFWSIRSINSTAIELDTSFNNGQGVGRGWYSEWRPTGIYKLYTKFPIILSSLQTYSGAEGTPSSRVTISGGWDQVSMSSQIGNTWLCGNFVSSCLSGGNTACLNISKFGAHRSNTSSGTVISASPLDQSKGPIMSYIELGACGIGISTNFVSSEFSNIQSCGCVSPGNFSGTGQIAKPKFTNCIFYGGTFGFGATPSAYSAESFAINCRGFNITNSGVLSSISPFLVKDCISKDCGSGSINGFQVVGTTYVGIGTRVMNGLYNCYSFDNSVGYSNTSGQTYLFNCSSSGNSTAGISCSTGAILAKNMNITDSTLVSFTASGVYGFARISGVNGSSTDNRIYYYGGTVVSETSVTKPGSGIAWKFSPTDANICTSSNPLSLLIGSIPCNSGQTFTASYWAARDSSNIAMQLRIPGGQWSGIGSPGNDVITSMAPTPNASPGSGDFVQYSISATPTENCVVNIFGEVWGGTSNNGYIDGPVTVVYS